MDAATWIALGALLVAVLSLLGTRRVTRRQQAVEGPQLPFLGVRRWVEALEARLGGEVRTAALVKAAEELGS